MWTVLEHSGVAKTAKKLPREILEKYEFWKNVVMHSGPQGLRLIRGFNDEALKGNLKGYRSSRLNDQWRVIYQVDGTNVRVIVEKITPHVYR